MHFHILVLTECNGKRAVLWRCFHVMFGGIQRSHKRILGWLTEWAVQIRQSLHIISADQFVSTWPAKLLLKRERYPGWDSNHVSAKCKAGVPTTTPWCSVLAVSYSILILLAFVLFWTIRVALYGCETWSFTLWEEHRLRMLENKVLRRIFGPGGGGGECGRRLETTAWWGAS